MVHEVKSLDSTTRDESVHCAKAGRHVHRLRSGPKVSDPFKRGHDLHCNCQSRPWFGPKLVTSTSAPSIPLSVSKSSIRAVALLDASSLNRRLALNQLLVTHTHTLI